MSLWAKGCNRIPKYIKIRDLHSTASLFWDSKSVKEIGTLIRTLILTLLRGRVFSEMCFLSFLLHLVALCFFQGTLAALVGGGLAALGVLPLVGGPVHVCLWSQVFGSCGFFPTLLWWPCFDAKLQGGQGFHESFHIFPFLYNFLSEAFQCFPRLSTQCKWTCLSVPFASLGQVSTRCLLGVRSLDFSPKCKEHIFVDCCCINQVKSKRKAGRDGWWWLHEAVAVAGFFRGKTSWRHMKTQTHSDTRSKVSSCGASNSWQMPKSDPFVSSKCDRFGEKGLVSRIPLRPSFKEII